VGEGGVDCLPRCDSFNHRDSGKTPAAHLQLNDTVRSHAGYELVEMCRDRDIVLTNNLVKKGVQRGSGLFPGARVAEARTHPRKEGLAGNITRP
jgi:hypothetical protein